MFDRPPPSGPDMAQPETDPVADSVERLCRLYDTRLAEPGGEHAAHVDTLDRIG